MDRFTKRLTHRFKQRFRHPPQARPASRLDQNGLRQCVRVAGAGCWGSWSAS